MKTRNLIIYSILVVVVLVIGLYFIYTSTNTSSVSVASYTSEDKEKPVVKIEKDLYDFGSIKVSEKKSNDFIIENVGKKPLQLSNITTSCGCTFAKVIYMGKESPEFDMHSQGNYIAEILPGKKAIIRVTYKPYVMPVYGFVERETYIKTNDPSMQDIVFKVTANVK